MILLLFLACGRLDSTDSPPQESESGVNRDTGLLWGEEDVLDLYPFEGENHLQPTTLLVSSINRQAYSYAQLSESLAVVDMDSRTLLGAHSVPGSGGVALFDGGKAVYLTRQTPPLQLFDPEDGSFEALVVGLETVTGVLQFSETKTAICGTSPDGSYMLQVHDRSKEHARLSFKVLPEAPQGLLRIDAQHLGVVMGQSAETSSVEIRAKADLALVRTCPAPFGSSAFALTPEGDVLLASKGLIGLAPCSETLESREVQVLELGVDNLDVLQSPSGMVVLDRIGEPPNWSMARLFDTSTGSLTLLRSFQTGRESVSGGRDNTTGLIWMNSEGTTEAWALDPKDGSTKARLPLGLHIESMAASDIQGKVLVSGRLSSLLAIVDFGSGTTEVLEHSLQSPVSPTFYEGYFYVLDQLNGSLHRFDGLSLSEGQSLDLGWENLDSQMLSHLSLHPERGTLLISHGAADEVIEIELESFTIGSRIPLGTPLAPDAAGRLELIPYGQGVLAIRSADGRVVEIDLDGESLRLHEPLLGALNGPVRLQLSALSTDQSLLYIGPHAVSTNTWQAAPAMDRDWTFAVHQDAEGDWIGWRESEGALVRYDADGVALETVSTGFGPQARPEWIPTPWGGRYIATDMGLGTLNAFSFRE